MESKNLHLWEWWGEEIVAYLRQKDVYICGEWAVSPNLDEQPEYLIDPKIVNHTLQTTLKAIKKLKRIIFKDKHKQLTVDEEHFMKNIEMEASNSLKELKELEDWGNFKEVVRICKYAQKQQKDLENYPKPKEWWNKWLPPKQSLLWEYLVHDFWNRASQKSHPKASYGHDNLIEDLKEKYSGDQYGELMLIIDDLLRQNYKLKIQLNWKQEDAETDVTDSWAYNYLELNDLYNLPTRVNFSKNSEMMLNMSDFNHWKFIASLEKRLPPLIKLDLIKIPSSTKNILNFMKEHFPTELVRLDLNWKSQVRDIEDFIPEISTVAKSITQVILLHNFKVSQPQMARIFKGCKNIPKLCYYRCDLDLNTVYDFKDALEGSNMTTFNVTDCGDPIHGDWGNNLDHFQNLIEGLSSSSELTVNLQELWIGKCMLEEETIREVLSKYGFETTKIKKLKKPP